MSIPGRTFLLAAVLPPFVILVILYTSDIHGVIYKVPHRYPEFVSSGKVPDVPTQHYVHTKVNDDEHAGAASHVNWPKPFIRHIVAVGDLHGDLANARRVLHFSGVVNEFGDWSGHADFFVQTGDIIDRGDDTIALFDWMDKLHGQAALAGGTVLLHLGNHEWMNAIGDWRYVYPSEIKTFGSVANRQKVLSTGRIGRSWARNYTTASRLPLHSSLGPPNTPFPPPSQNSHSTHRDVDGPLSHSAISFVHGGLSPTYRDLTPFPTRINELSDSLLRKLQRRRQPPPHPPHPYPMLPTSVTQAEYDMYEANGPVWYRGWALDGDEKVCKDVDAVLAKTGTRRMIMGHTPNFTGIVSRCGGKIIIIDTGISHAYNGVLSALSIHYTLTPVVQSEAEEQVWIEREVVSALYADRQEILVDEEQRVTGDLYLSIVIRRTGNADCTTYKKKVHVPFLFVGCIITRL